MPKAVQFGVFVGDTICGARVIFRDERWAVVLRRREVAEATDALADWCLATRDDLLRKIHGDMQDYTEDKFMRYMNDLMSISQSLSEVQYQIWECKTNE